MVEPWLAATMGDPGSGAALLGTGDARLRLEQPTAARSPPAGRWQAVGGQAGGVDLDRRTG